MMADAKPTLEEVHHEAPAPIGLSQLSSYPAVRFPRRAAFSVVPRRIGTK
jgi:hypothetical protein